MSAPNQNPQQFSPYQQMPPQNPNQQYFNQNPQFQQNQQFGQNPQNQPNRQRHGCNSPSI